MSSYRASRVLSTSPWLLCTSCKHLSPHKSNRDVVSNRGVSRLPSTALKRKLIIEANNFPIMARNKFNRLSKAEANVYLGSNNIRALYAISKHLN